TDLAERLHLHRPEPESLDDSGEVLRVHVADLTQPVSPSEELVLRSAPPPSPGRRRNVEAVAAWLGRRGVGEDDRLLPDRGGPHHSVGEHGSSLSAILLRRSMHNKQTEKYKYNT